VDDCQPQQLQQKKIEEKGQKKTIVVISILECLKKSKPCQENRRVLLNTKCEGTCRKMNPEFLNY
jgi:hypothetical protein